MPKNVVVKKNDLRFFGVLLSVGPVVDKNFEGARFEPRLGLLLPMADQRGRTHDQCPLGLDDLSRAFAAQPFLVVVLVVIILFGFFCRECKVIFCGPSNKGFAFKKEEGSCPKYSISQRHKY